MNWDSYGLDARLVADDGEVLDRVRWVHGTSEYEVESTGKTYVGLEAAKRAAEQRHNRLTANFDSVTVAIAAEPEA